MASSTSGGLLGDLTSVAAPAINGLSLTSGVPLLVENILPPLLNSTLFDQVFFSLRGAWSSDLMPITTTGNDTTPNFDFSQVNNILDVGAPFTLFTSLPQPGSVISLADNLGDIADIVQPTTSTPSNGTRSSSVSGSPSGTNVPTYSNSTGSSNSSSSNGSSSSSSSFGTTNYTMFTIPEGAFVTSQWHFFKKDGNDSAFVPAKKAMTSGDASGHYQILNGSSFGTFSGASQYVFWPAPSTTGDIREVAACLNTTIFIPGSTSQSIAAPLCCLGTRINSWTSIFGNITNGIIQHDPSNLAFPTSFQNLFGITVDTTAPQPGKPVTLSVLPIDKSTLLAPKIESILDSNPDLKVSAAIDLGAPVNAYINAVVKSVTGLFRPGSGSSGVANKIGGGVLSVANVLDGLLSVPLAVEFSGRQLTKTLTPNVGDDILPNIASLPGLGALAGSLPIGSLTAQIASLANNITAVAQPASAIVTHQALDIVHGLVLNILPDFIAAGSRALSNEIVIEIGLNPSILLPGLPAPLTQNIYLGSITIIKPTITLPQIALFFHDNPYLSISQPDILVAIDPVTFRLVSDINSLIDLLSDLKVLVSQIRQIFPDTLLQSLNADLNASLDNLLQVAGSLFNIVINPTYTGSNAKLNLVDFSQPGIPGFDCGSQGSDWGPNDNNGLSSILYIGFAAAPSYFLFIDVVWNDGTTGTVYFHGLNYYSSRLNQFSGHLADKTHYSDSLIYAPGVSFWNSDVAVSNFSPGYAHHPLNQSTAHNAEFDNRATHIYFRKVLS